MSDEMLDLPEIRLDRGPIKFASLVAAGGWCAPDEDIYKINEPMSDADARVFWYEASERYRKRAEKAEKKLRRIRKVLKP